MINNNKIKIPDTRCEYMKNPMGIDIQKLRLSWVIDADGPESKRRNIIQAAYRVQVSKGDSSFNNLVWDSGIIESDQSLHIEYKGQELISCSRYYYRIKVWDQAGNESEWSEKAFWEMGLLKEEDWKAQWISADLKDKEKKVNNSNLCTEKSVIQKDGTDPCLYLRKNFKLQGNIEKARIYVSALGLYELKINNEKVGEYLFTPGWTSYNKRIQYQTYDVTSMLNDGGNAIAIILGNGWYRGQLGWNKKRWIEQKGLYGDKLATIAQLHIVYKDGKEEVVTTDKSWRSSTGPILMSELYHGETYDARLEKRGWEKAGYNDDDWQGVSIINKDKQTLIAHEGAYVKKIEKIKPIKLIKTPLGEKVIDMGQNMVGWIKFNVKGKRGDRVILKHGEVLDKEGNFYIENLRIAEQKIEYILKGERREIYEPHFTFQGFRYVKIVEFPEEPTLDNFEGVVIHSDMEPVGGFECSNGLINQLQNNIIWGQKGNFLDVPTDCPQRDERLGWTGDAQVFIRTACFNMNVALFFKKWLKDLHADQKEDGQVAHVVPHVLEEDSFSSSAWADAAVICPWTLYLCYGDKRILEEQYDSMKSWVEYIRSQGNNEYLWNTGFHFGDWLALDGDGKSPLGGTADDYIATAFYANSTQLLAKTAKVLGKLDDMSLYQKLHKDILKEFRKEFVTPKGRISVPTQTAHVLALIFNLIEEKDRERTIKTLVKYLKKNNYHLKTGFIGTPYLCHVLSQNGYNDIANKLLMQTDYPSWLYQITKGATTVWERWNGIKEDGSFETPSMNSFNHYAYGSIGDWLYRVVAGIEIDENKPGYKNVIIKPQPSKEFEYVKAHIVTGYGKVVSSWKRKESGMEMEVQIPHNTTGEVLLPDANINCLLESGINVQGKKIEGILSWEETPSGIKVNLGSGEYKFTW